MRPFFNDVNHELLKQAAAYCNALGSQCGDALFKKSR